MRQKHEIDPSDLYRQQLEYELWLAEEMQREAEDAFERMAEENDCDERSE